MIDPSALLERLLAREHLREEEAGDLMGVLVDPAVEAAMKGSLLVALRAKGETPEEVRGLAIAMRNAATPLPRKGNGPLVDTCGTGGDGSHSFNVSTATALLVAAAGVAVAKHGNRSVSSRSGSADVLEALGIALPTDPALVAAAIDDRGFGFLFAPVFHPAMAAVVPVRRALRVRTVFNVLGPLTNPARPAFQLVGAYSEAVAALMAETLAGMAIERAFVVHGTPHWDEATPMGPFVRFDVRDGVVRRDEIDPHDYGIGRCLPEDLAGGDAAHNASLLRAVFTGRRGPLRDAVVLNTALVFQLIGRAASAQAAADQAAAVIDDGRAAAFLDGLTQ